MKQVVNIVLFLFILTGCIREDTPRLDNLEFVEGNNYYKITADAIRIRDHKTISLDIDSEKSTSGMAISIKVKNYTDAFHYKILPDSNLFINEQVEFVYIINNYYESNEGYLLIHRDDDKTIKGEFGFTAQNVFDSTDIITVKKGYFEIDYSESMVIERKY